MLNFNRKKKEDEINGLMYRKKMFIEENIQFIQLYVHKNCFLNIVCNVILILVFQK